MQLLQDLTKFLKLQKNYCTGTLKLKRKYVPSRVTEQKLNTGELIVRHTGPVSVIKWNDRKTSNIHVPQ